MELRELIGKQRLFLSSLLLLSRSVVSNSLRPHGLQHARPPCPSLTLGAYSNSCLLSRWCHPTIPSSVVPFFSCLQSFPASGSIQMSQFYALGGQSTGVSASASALPMKSGLIEWLNNNLFIWLHWVFVAACGLFLVSTNRLLVTVTFSCCRLQA